MVASVGGGLAAAPAIAARPFGKTGVQVSIVGLGGGARFYEPVPTDEAGAELVRKAIDSGITFIETAANYGPRRRREWSERRIGLAMKTHRPRGVPRDEDRPARLRRGHARDGAQPQAAPDRPHRPDAPPQPREPTDLEKIAGARGAEKAIRKMVDQKVVRFRGFSCHDPALTLEADRSRCSRTPSRRR